MDATTRSAIPDDSPLPRSCPMCGALADEHHDQDDFEAEWASYDCELVLMIVDSGDIEWDNGCEVALRRWIDNANKARRAWRSRIVASP